MDKDNTDILEFLIKAREDYRNRLHEIHAIIQQRPHIEKYSEVALGKIIKWRGGKKYYISGVGKNEILIHPFSFDPDDELYGRPKTWHNLDKFDIQ